MPVTRYEEMRKDLEYSRLPASEDPQVRRQPPCFWNSLSDDEEWISYWDLKLLVDRFMSTRSPATRPSP